MAGYRFCRSDDVPLLVAAYNTCYLPHFPGDRAMTVEDFKSGIRELNLWSSSCMLALAGGEPIGVLLAAKRDEANLVHRIGVRPGHERRGHGRHLVASLARKLAILGPPLLLAEVPAEHAGVRRFAEAAGFGADSETADFVLDAPPPAAGRSDLISEVTVDDVVESGAFDRSLARSWERSLATLANRRAEIQGLAVASDVAIEAHLLHRKSPATGETEVVALGATPQVGRALFPLLLRRLFEERGGPIRIPRVSEREAGFAWLAELGFRRERDWIGYALTAAAG